MLFWHVVNDTIYLPGPKSDLPGRTFIPDLLRMGPRQRGEQYVIRLSSNLAPDAMVRSPVVQALMRRLDARGVMKSR